MAQNVNQISRPFEGFYLIDRDATYQEPKPCPTDNLLAKYSLEPIAASLGRVKNDGSKGVKLRKSYKNHISDLPGKHQIPVAKPLNGSLLDPDLPNRSDIIAQFNPELLSNALKFDRTPVNGIPGFLAADLAIGDQNSSMRTDDAADTEENKKKRKKKQASAGDLKRHHP